MNNLDLSEKYQIKDMIEWNNVNADLIITDPPFGINFDGKKGNYNRNHDSVVSGYREWKESDYKINIENLLKCCERNLKPEGEALIFSGFVYTNIIHDCIIKSNFHFQSKMYWIYNFAIYAKHRPSINVYEIFWITKDEKNWIYNRECNTDHCRHGEANLASLFFKREKLPPKMLKYPTRLPLKLLECLIEHFSNKGDLIFDPLTGSGMVGIAANLFGRDFLLGDKNSNGKKVFQELLNYYKIDERQKKLDFI